MDKFLGREVAIAFPTRSGKRVLYVVDAQNKKDWLFVTSEVMSISVTNYSEIAEIIVSTRNSVYAFERKIREFSEDLVYEGGETEVVICDQNGREATCFGPGDRVKLLSMPYDWRGHHATGWSYWTVTIEVPGGYWVDEYEED